MLYEMYQAQDDLTGPMRAMARLTSAWIGHTPDWMRSSAPIRNLAAGLDVFASTGVTHAHPPFAIDHVKVGNRTVAVQERVVHSLPFGDLLRFEKDIATEQPRLLVVAPISGHFATLLRGTVTTLLPDHDVYITDWRNARDAPLAAGAFGFDDYVAHVIAFLEAIGPGAHLMGVCQPCAHALAAVAIMAEDDNPATPLTMTLMAGPVDTRINPTKVNALAKTHPIDWFERELIDTVPARHAGAGRRVYPGFTQLTAFLLMNLSRHMDAHIDLYSHLAAGREVEAGTAKTFYDEYFAVLDLTAEFYLETVSRVFQDHLLPRGELLWRGRKVDPGAIRRTALFTVEGERDDICSVGQTVAAHDLCSNIFANRKRHHLQPGVGHYGVFNGKKWQTQIYPLVRNLILATN